jgi:hypothetical protein
MKKREDRRDRTWRISERRWREHRRDQQKWPGARLLERGHFADRGGMTCDCRRKRHGNPKLGIGCCYACGLRWTVVMRIKGRREEHELVRLARSPGAVADADLQAHGTWSPVPVGRGALRRLSKGVAVKPNPIVEALLARHRIAYPRSGFTVGEGWLPIVDVALGRMVAAGWDRELHQVKEKLGGLRIYIGQGSDELKAIIAAAAAEAARTCECCGDPGSRRDVDGWLATLCNPCELREGAARNG